MPNPSANIDNADSTEDIKSEIPWRRRTTMLKTKESFESFDLIFAKEHFSNLKLDEKGGN